LTALTGVLGFPVGHSRSPAMMGAAFAALGLDWRYLKLPLPPERFAETVKVLPASGYVGANVTIPHKLAAAALGDRLSPAATAIGAANTLTFRDGAIEADNTDAGGFLDALGELPQGRALVLGAGGTARAVVWALRQIGADILVWNRTAKRAKELCRELGGRQVERAEASELLVNATSVGLGAEDEGAVLDALGLAQTEPPSVLVDFVYGDEPSALCRWAERGGARVVDGLDLLVRQGARSLRLWTGSDAPLEVMRQASGRRLADGSQR
jgi:shikimate dehydrogenase